MLNVSSLPTFPHSRYTTTAVLPSFTFQFANTPKKQSFEPEQDFRPYRPSSAFTPFVQVPVPIRPKADPTLLPHLPPSVFSSAPSQNSPPTFTFQTAFTPSNSLENSHKRKLESDENTQDLKSPKNLKDSRKKRRLSKSEEDSHKSDEGENDEEDSTSSSSSSDGTSLAFAVPTRGPFTCPVEHCDCRYTRRYDMKMHFLTKHPESVSQFPEILNLKKSSKDGKKWQCPFPECICGYTRKGDLKGHLLKRHPGECNKFPDILRPRSTKENKKFQCPIPNCQCGYMRKFDLKSHVYAKHPNQVNLFEDEYEHIEDNL